MKHNQFARLLQACAVVLILGGCAVGQRYSYRDAPVPMSRVSTTGTVAIAVQDRRPYIVNRDKAESFVGLMRGGFGNPFDVKTVSGQPMAVEMRDSIVEGMRSKGIDAKVVNLAPADSADKVQRALMETGARKLVLVTLTEWKSDMMISAALHFDATVVILNDKGEEIARARTSGRDNIGPSPHSSVRPAFVRKFESLFDDEKIVQALK